MNFKYTNFNLHNKRLVSLTSLRLWSTVVCFLFSSSIAFAQNINIWRGAFCGSTTTITTGGPTGPCNFCDGLIVARNIIDLLTQLSIALAVGIIVWGAIQMMIAGGSEEKIANSKKTISSAVTGIIITLAAWIIINTIIGILAPGNFVLPWHQIKCQ